MRFDHLVIAATRLEDGVDWVETRLGVTLAPGGRHAAMGTQNRLLSLGPAEYLEVIAIDPGAPGPAGGLARWYGLDDFRGPPRPVGWVMGVDDLETALAAAPPGTGHSMAVSRGDLHWRLAVAPGGVMPFDGLFPGLIAWPGGVSPAAHLPDQGCRLTRLALDHPQADALAGWLPGQDARRVICAAPPGLRAEIATPAGLRVLA